MRIWSLHPAYLDAKGLVALWRETLLAKHVLLGKTKGYKNHPQLDRFKMVDYSLDYINQYLYEVYLEASSRGYHFNKTKVDEFTEREKLTVTSGQMQFEREHLERKLKVRDQKALDCLVNSKNIITHPMFKIVEGGIESWEIV